MRSSQLMSRADSAVVLVDVQEKLIRLIDGYDRVVARCRFALQVARLLGLPILTTEQYSKGLGHTVEALSEFVVDPIEKMAFSGGCEVAVLARLRRHGVAKVLLIGIETHVCVSQTAFDLQSNGFRPYIAADAVGSRKAEDKAIALARFAQNGIQVTTTEAAGFEWAETAAATEFRAFSQLVKAADLADSTR